ncbi:MAG: SRPBCC family protein [Solimonas sp.]
MLKLILMVIALLVLGLLLYAATRPDDFRVERSISIKAPAEKVFPLINDLHRWQAWSPYEKRDPAMKRHFSGTDSGVGAAYAWDGNNQVGSGRMEIIESSAPLKIRIQLDFLKPFEGHNTAEFTLLPAGDATQVSWAMYGPANYMSKLMGLFCDMDQMIGKDFAAGLASLKTVSER